MTKINFFYHYIDYTSNNLMIMYRYLIANRAQFAAQGYDLRFHDVSAMHLQDIKNAAADADVNVIDIMVRKVLMHDNASVPYTQVIRRLREPEHYMAVYDHLINAPGCRIFFGQSFDLHWHGIDINTLKNIDGFFWIYEKEPTQPKDVPTAYHDDWFNKNENPHDVWTKITTMIPSRAEISFPVDTRHSRVRRKFFDYIVAGANYNTRNIAGRKLQETGLRPAPYKYAEYLAPDMAKTMHKIGFSRYVANTAYNALRAFNYETCIERSRIAFSCGSGLNYPVRKFFQIPALGAAMLAYPCTGFYDYGFKDGENCIVTAPEDAGKEALHLINNPTLLEKVTFNGWQHVVKEHSLANRADQLLTCIRKIGEGKIINGQYRGGRFDIQER